METVQHLIGVCHDNHSHIDLIDIIIGGCGVLGLREYIQYKFKRVKSLIKYIYDHI